MKLLLTTAIAGLILTGCSKSIDSKSKSFSYPLALGNQWTYSCVLTWVHGSPIEIDTVPGNSASVILTVERVDTIRSGVLSYTLRGIDVGSEMIDGIPERKYLNLAEGMYLLSSKQVVSSAAGASLPRRIPHSPNALTGDVSSPQAPSIPWLGAALPDAPGLADCQAADPADTLPLILAYPQHTGLFWTFRDSSDMRPYRIDKVIEGREAISTPAGTFDCWRIRFIYTPSFGTDIVDYVSPEGLIRRRIVGRLWNGTWITNYDLTSLTLR